MKTRTYDLEERTAKFGESVIELCLQLTESHTLNSFYKRYGHKLSQQGQKSAVTSDQDRHTQIVIRDHNDD